MTLADAGGYRVEVPEPMLTPRELIQRAEAMRDRLRAEAAATEKRGCYSPELDEAFRKAGFYRMIQPRMFGGHEFDFATFYKVIIEIARGDPSTAWCLSLASGHAYTLGSHYSAAAQAEIFGPKGEFRCPSRAAPKGTVVPVEGGYIVNGQWDFCSGIPYATHVMQNSHLRREGAPPQMVSVVVPRDRYVIEDDWGDVLGLRGSGSNSCTVKDAFVPEHYVVPVDWMERDARATPGTELHGNPMYLGMIVGFYHGETVSVAVGAAKAALDEFELIVHNKKTTKPPQIPRFQNQDYQQTFGLAVALADSAEALVLATGRQHLEYCQRWAAAQAPFTQEMAMRLRGMLQTAGQMAVEAVQLLFAHCGATATKDGERMQRYLRDVMTYKTHVQAQNRTTAHDLARRRWGIGN